MKKYITRKNVKLCFTVLGMALGILSIIFGICVASGAGFTGIVGTFSYIKFGGDYYTESYEVMASTNNLLYNIYNLIEKAFGYILIIMGGAINIKYTLKFADILDTKKEEQTTAQNN